MEKFCKKTNFAILFEREKIIVNQILSSKLWFIGQIYSILKWLYRKENCKGNIEFPLVYKNVTPLWHLVQIFILKGGLSILGIDTQLNSLKNKWIQKLLNPTNVFSKDLMLYRLNLILNSKRDLVLFRQTQIFRSTKHKNLQKLISEIFLMQLLNPCLHFTNIKFTIPVNIDEILEQPIILNLHTKLNIISNNPYFYSIPLRNIADKFTMIRDVCRFSQPGLISYTRFEEKLVHNSQCLEAKNSKRNLSKIPL